MKDEFSTEELQRLALRASRDAVARARKAGIPYTVQKGKKIIQIKPDGSEEIVGDLPKAYCRPKKKHYHIA